MLRFLYADQLAVNPVLARGMFRDRASQFRDRLGWDVTVDTAGEERDAYDRLNPLYVIWERPDGTHGGSMRFLPTTGPVMVNDHFSSLLSGPVCSPHIWECTRFCLAPRADAHVAGALMLAGGCLMRRFGLRHLVGVFDARMVRIYGRIGASPEVLGQQGGGAGAIKVGLWSLSVEAEARVAAGAGITPEQCRFWCDSALGPSAAGALRQSA